MNNPQNLLSDDQRKLVRELIADYGISNDEITFFAGEPEPFIGYEASCVMCNALAPEISGIDVEPVESAFVDSLSIKCTLTFSDSRVRSAVGVVNANETIGERTMEPQQRFATATARAIRHALRVGGIDLVKRHQQKNQNVADTSPEKSHRNTLLAEVHALGQEAGLITTYTDGPDKRAWKAFLYKRYRVESSQLLNDDLLADLASVLRGITAPLKRAA